MKTFLAAIIFVGLAVILLGVNIFFFRRPFPDGEISTNPEMQKRGIKCAKQEEMEMLAAVVPEMMERRERYLVFSDDYLNFVGEYPESHYRKELDGLYRRVQGVLGTDAPDAQDQTAE